MARQIIITMTDEQYAVLAEAAQGKGQPVEMLVQEILAQQPLPAIPPSLDPLVEHLYRKGKIDSLPTGKRETASEQAERERLARTITPGKSPSEMIMEDRGP